MTEGGDYAAASTIGARERQEDDWGTHVNPPALEPGAWLLAVVADGMGGMPAGDRASSIALRAFLDSYAVLQLPAPERLRRALAHANREMAMAVEAEPELAGMGSTLVAALVFPDRCEWLSVGDSLLLCWREGELKRINPLHVYANVLDERVRRGEMTAEVAERHPERAWLTSALQGTPLEEVARGELPLVAGDVLVFASDGIATLADKDVAAICAERVGEGASGIAETLVARIEAAARERQDNATVIVVCCGPKGGDDSPGVGDGDSEAAPEPPATAGDQEVEEAVADATVVPARRDLAAGLRSWQRVAGGFVVGLLAATAAWHLVGGF